MKVSTGLLAVPDADAAILHDVLRGVLGRRGDAGWRVQPDRMWCLVTAPEAVTRGQGWKLHVSATPLSAPLVLARSAEILIRHGCTFKFAADLAAVTELIGPHQDRAVSGKFITAYPRDDDQFRVVADELDRATAELTGPRILSDRPLHPGSLVHYRYGGFAPDFVLTDEGVFDPCLTGPDDATVSDERRPWFSPPSWATPPFPQPQQPAAGAAMLLAGRFRMTRALRHSNRGGVFEAVDRTDDRPVIVKQSRAHIGATLGGSDVRDLLRHEARMLRALAPLGLFPAFLDLFEEQGDLFLAESRVEGVAADVWAYDVDGDQRQAPEVWAVARSLTRAVHAVHEAGYVLGDLKPGNVMVTPDAEVRFVDAEVVAEPAQRRIRGYTIGYAPPELSPDLSARQSPSPTTDCFSLGVTLFWLASGGSPAHWVSGRPGAPRSRAQRHRLLTQIAAGRPALPPLVELIVGLTETDPHDRWSTAVARTYLEADPGAGRPTVRVAPAEGPATGAEVDRLLTDGIEHLRRGMAPREPYLWRSDRATVRHDPCDAWRGAAGVLATLIRTARLRPSTFDTVGLDTVGLDMVRQAAAWIDERLYDVPRILPGLSFGRAGTAIALHDAAVLLGDGGLAARALALAHRLPVHGPNADVANGLSGAGLARIRLWQATGDPVLRDDALTVAEAVLALADRDGEQWRWPIPLRIGATSGTHSSYGFAHGIAGIATFLLHAAEVADRAAARNGGATNGAAATNGPAATNGAATNEAAGANGAADGAAGRRDELSDLAARLWQAARGAGETLLRAARPDRNGLVWPATPGGADRIEGLHWCNGPTGVGMFLIRLAAATGDDRFADAARRCALASHGLWASPPGACCGLAGAGQLLLDLTEVTGENRWRADAAGIAEVVAAQAVVVDGLRISSEPEHGYAYGVGTAGVLDFLIRLRHGGPGPWLPDLPAAPVAVGAHPSVSMGIPVGSTHRTVEGGEHHDGHR
jgi:hypothetical protein